MPHHFKKILVPVDFSACSEEALECANALAQATDATLDVLHVWEAPMYAGAEHVVVKTEGGERVTIVQLVHRAAERELEAFVERMKRRGIAMQARLMAGDPAAVIASEAKGFDVVVMGTHGRGAIARLFLGSVAERLIRTSPCPVLTVRSVDPKKQ